MKIPDLAGVFLDEANHTCVRFKYKTIVVGGYYLPPSLNLAICKERPPTASEYVEEQSQDVFLVGDLNLRMGLPTGDSIKNFRT